MPATTTITPLHERVTLALEILRHARQDGDATRIVVAAQHLDLLCDRLPRT